MTLAGAFFKLFLRISRIFFPIFLKTVREIVSNGGAKRREAEKTPKLGESNVKIDKR